MPDRIIAVDDESSMLDVIEAMLTNEGYEVSTFSDAEKAIEYFKKNGADLIISDIKMEPMDGISVLKQIKSINDNIPVILITAFANAEDALSAVKIGAYDYIQKPFKIGKLRSLIKRALSISKALYKSKISNDLIKPKSTVEEEVNFFGIVTKNMVMKKLFSMIEKAAPSKTTILIQGESGTGKELIAKAIHSTSGRTYAPFIPINCGALPDQLLESELFGHVKGSFTGAYADKDGLFKVAQDGTLFLDEISTMSISLQTKLLRVLQEKEIRPVGGTKNTSVKCRVIAATNESLEDLIDKNLFREDLYYRLNIIPIEVPPLRERIQDIIPIIDYFITKYAPDKKFTISPSAMNILVQYDWPGNIRQLENTIERIATLCSNEQVSIDDLPALIVKNATFKNHYTKNKIVPLETFAKVSQSEYILSVLKTLNNDKIKTAEKLEITLETLNGKIKKIEN